MPESGCSSSHAITSFFLFQHKHRVNSDKFDRRNKGQLTIWRSQLVGTRYSSRNSVEHPGPSKAFRRYRRIPVKHKFRFNWRIITGQDEAVAGKKMIGNRWSVHGTFVGDLQINSRFGSRFYRVSLTVLKNRPALTKRGKFGSNPVTIITTKYSVSQFGPIKKTIRSVTNARLAATKHVPLSTENIFIFNSAAGFARTYYPSLYKNGYRPGIWAKINIRIASIAEAFSD